MCSEEEKNTGRLQKEDYKQKSKICSMNSQGRKVSVLHINGENVQIAQKIPEEWGTNERC